MYLSNVVIIMIGLMRLHLSFKTLLLLSLNLPAGRQV